MKRLWLGFFLVAKVWAGDSVGHGGDLVVCPTTRDILDYFEARQADPSYRLGFQGMSSTAQAKVKWALDRLALRDPRRAEIYQRRLEKFQQESLLVTGPLENVLDTGEAKIPDECEVQQLAIQRPPAFPSDKRYLIDEKLWAGLESASEQQAGLMLHEIIYRETLGLGHVDSSLTREFNRVISGERFLELSQGEYEALSERVFAPLVYVAFKQSEFTFHFSQKEITIGLRPLLAQVGTGAVHWYTDSSAPNWLKVNSATEQLEGIATSGEFRFQLVVKQGNASALAGVTVIID